MDKISKNKTVIILSVALVAVVAAIAVAFVLQLSGPKTMIDLSKLSEKEVQTWYKSEFNDPTHLVINNKFDEKIEANKFISQSIPAGKEITRDDKLVVVFSKGPNPDTVVKLPDFVKENYNKAKIEKFFTDNKFLDVTYEYVISDKALDTVLKVNVSNQAKRKDVVLVTLSVGDKVENISVKVPDLTSFTLNNAKSWASGNAINLKVSYVYSDEFAKDKVISQSVKKDTVVKGGSTINVEVSKGKEIVMKDLTNMAWADAKKWAHDNDLSIYYTEKYSSTVAYGHVISQTPYAGTSLSEGGSVDVVLSLGKDPSSIKIDIESYVGKTESAFLKYIAGLTKDGYSFDEPSKLSGRYSDSIAKDLVLSHTVGTTSVTSTIEYYLSLGSYNLDANNFNGKSYSDAKTAIETANSKGAGVSLSVGNGKYNSSYGYDVLHACAVSGKNVSCSKSLGSYVFDAEDYNGTSESDANSLIARENELGAGIAGLTVSGEEHNSSYGAGQLFACAYDGSNITCKKSLGAEEEKASIPNAPQAFSANTYDQAVANVESALGMFDLRIEAVEDDKDGYTSGTVLSISVNGDTGFKSGEYPLSTVVVVRIVK